MDQINKLDNYFPTPRGNNDYLIDLINKTSEILCNWFSEADNFGPLPTENSFKYSMPDENGSSLDVLFSEIESLIYDSFNPVHPGSIAHLDPPPLIISILGDLIAAGLNNNLLANELSPGISLLEESICKWISKRLGFDDLKKWLAENIPNGDWVFDAKQISDSPLNFIVGELTREKIFLRLHDELPYDLEVKTIEWKNNNDSSCSIFQDIYVSRDSQKGIVLGKKGEVIKEISIAARKEISNFLGKKVHLFLRVRTKKSA